MLDFSINQTFNEIYPPEAADWCNTNNAYIKELTSIEGTRVFRIESLPSPSEEELNERKLNKAKTERAKAVSNILVKVDGLVFDGDEVSQERMSRAVTAALAAGESMSATTTWVLHDNTVATVTIKQLATALRLAGEEQTRLWTVPYEASYIPAEAA